LGQFRQPDALVIQKTPRRLCVGGTAARIGQRRYARRQCLRAAHMLLHHDLPTLSKPCIQFRFLKSIPPVSNTPRKFVQPFSTKKMCRSLGRGGEESTPPPPPPGRGGGEGGRDATTGSSP